MSVKVEEFKELLKDPEVQEYFKRMIQNCLVDAGIFTRLNMIEENLGADEFHCVGRDLAFESGISEYDEEREPLPTIPERVKSIYTDLNDISCTSKVIYVSGNETEIRARLLYEKLPEVKYKNGKLFMTSKEVQEFLLNEVPEEHRTTKKASRKVANDVMRKAAEIYPEVLKLSKNTKGLNVIEYLENR